MNDLAEANDCSISQVDLINAIVTMDMYVMIDRHSFAGDAR